MPEVKPLIEIRCPSCGALLFRGTGVIIGEIQAKCRCRTLTTYSGKLTNDRKLIVK